jgi:hypothetical protein
MSLSRSPFLDKVVANLLRSNPVINNSLFLQAFNPFKAEREAMEFLKDPSSPELASFNKAFSNGLNAKGVMPNLFQSFTIKLETMDRSRWTPEPDPPCISSGCLAAECAAGPSAAPSGGKARVVSTAKGGGGTGKGKGPPGRGGKGMGKGPPGRGGKGKGKGPPGMGALGSKKSVDTINRHWPAGKSLRQMPGCVLLVSIWSTKCTPI